VNLIALQARWIHEHMFAFLCPHCQKVLLTCKDIVLSMHDQGAIFEKAFGEDWNLNVVPCKVEHAWKFSSQDFATMTVTPSLDASASGHWHGFITNGAIA